MKYDIVQNDNGTITYKQRKTYHFDPEMSVGDDGQLMTSINIPLLVSKMLFNAIAPKL